MHAADRAGSMLATGNTLIAANPRTSVVTNAMPVTGISLPFSIRRHLLSYFSPKWA